MPLSLFQKSAQKGGETKTLIYQLLWVQKIYLHDCSKELQGGLCKYCTAFYLMMMTLGNLVNLWRPYSKALVNLKRSRNTHWPNHKINAGKTKNFITVFEDPTKRVIYDKNENKKYECNLYILKVDIQAVLLCWVQVLSLREHRGYGKFDVTREKGTDEKARRGKFHAVLNSFAMLDPIFRNHLKHGRKKSKMIW